MILTLPIPGFASIIGFAVLWFPGDGIEFSPSAALGAVLYPHGVQLDLYGISVLHQKNGRIQRHCRQPRHCAESIGDFPPAADRRNRRYLIAPFAAEVITLIIAVVLRKTSRLVYQ